MNNCIVCNSPIGRIELVTQGLYRKYFEAFNFYFAKPINELIAQVANTPHVISFKDFSIFDEEQELLKRFYQIDEVKPRVEILTDFYISNYKSIHPNLLIIDMYKIMDKRNHKIDKLFYQKLNHSNDSVNNQNQQVSKPVLNSKLTINSGVSFETDEHDIYDDSSPNPQSGRIDLRGLRIITNLHQLNASELEDDCLLDDQLDECKIQINLQGVMPQSCTNTNRNSLPQCFYRINDPTKVIRDTLQSWTRHNQRRNNQIDIREKKGKQYSKIGSNVNSKSESKHSQSSYRFTKLKDSVEQGMEEVQEIEQAKPKLLRVHSDTSTIQKMLKEYQILHKNTQLRSTISSELLPSCASTLIQGYQGSQKSIRQDHGSGSIHSSASQQRQEVLKRVYQQPRKSAQNQIDKIAKGGCLTERNSKKTQPMSDDIITKLHDFHQQQQRLFSNADKQKVELKYMIPSQYNTIQTAKSTIKAKSTTSKKIHNEITAKSQQFQSSTISQQKLHPTPVQQDDVVKKYMQFAAQSLGKHQHPKKFDFKLNFQALNQDNMQEESVEEDKSSKRINFLSDRCLIQSEREYASNSKKIVLK